MNTSAIVAALPATLATAVPSLNATETPPTVANNRVLKAGFGRNNIKGN